MLDLDKEYYVVDCYNFVYFPRIVHIIGITGSSADDEISYIIDKSTCFGEKTTAYKDELTRFKTFKDCENYCKYINEIPANKKRADDWNNPKTQYKLNMLKNMR